MADKAGYSGVNFTTLRKALYLMFFGIDNGKCNDLDSPKYRYIVPMQGNFDNPLQNMEKELAKNTFIQYWIVKDESLTQDFYSEDEEGFAVDKQKCIAHVMVRFIGKEAETWVKTFRHLTKRKTVWKIFDGVCGATKLEYTSPIIPRKINYFGKNSQIAFDVYFKLYYDECIRTGWLPLEGINFKVEGHIYTDDGKEV